jgi:hypothetical protein
MTTTLPIDQMIGTASGTVTREIFVSPDFHQQPATCSRTRRIMGVNHAGCACGIRAVQPKPRHGASSWSMPMRRRK